MSDRARIVVFVEPQRAVIEEEEVREPGEGEVLIQTICTLLSTGTELTAYSGDFPREKSAWANYVRYPFRPGYSLVGEIVQVGPGVTQHRVGDKVFAHARHASLVVHQAALVNRIPEGVTPEDAAFSSVSSIAMNGVRMAELGLGEAVIVVGAGIVGLMATQYAGLNGAFPLIGMDISERRLRRARDVGATHLIDPSQTDALTAVQEITKGRKADVAFEVTGNPSVIPGLPPLLHRRGRLILLGSPRGKTTIDFHDEVHTFGLKIIGAHASNHAPVETPLEPWTRARNIELFLDLLQAGRVHVSDLITHHYPWRQAPEVFQTLYQDRTTALGVVLDWRAG